MVKEKPYCECAFCMSIQELAREYAEEAVLECKRPCMRCGRHWTDPEHCYCAVLEEELAQ